MLFRWSFWADALTRGIRTFCQTLVAVLGGGALNVWTVGWHSALGVAAGSALLAVLMAVDRLSVAPTVDVLVEPAAAPVAPVGRFKPPAEVTVAACGDSLR